MEKVKYRNRSSKKKYKININMGELLSNTFC